MSNTDAGYTPSNGPEPLPGQGAQRAPFPVARLLYSFLFAIIGWFAFQAAIIASIIHWILIAINREQPHPEFRQFVRAMWTLADQPIEICGRYAKLARYPLQLAWIGLELREFIQLPPLLEPIAEQIDRLRDERI